MTTAPMRAPLIPSLRSTAATMTPALAKVAETVLNEPNAAIYLSITELADRCGASEGSVMRFCREQGFLGFQDFKLALARELATQDHTDSAEIAEDGVQNLVRTALTALGETERLLKRDALDQAARVLMRASVVTAYGAAASAITARYLEYKLVRIGARVRAFEDSHLALMTAATADKSSMFVAISSSGATQETVEFADLARSRGAYVLGITNRAKSPLAAKCDAVFIASWPETPHTGGAFPSKISQLLIVDALVQTVLSLSPELTNAIDGTAQSVTTRSY